MELLKVVVDAIDDVKARDIDIINMQEISPLVDYMVVCTGGSDRQVQAIYNKLKETVFEKGFDIKHIEGTESNLWVLVDCKDVIVHIFQQDERIKYNLERLWGDAPRISVSEVLA